MRLAVVAPSAGSSEETEELARPVPPQEAPKPSAPWALALEPILVQNANTGAVAEVTLYREDGELDARGLGAFSDIAVDTRPGAPRSSQGLAVRVVQLAVKAAWHFRAHTLVLISAYRPFRRGKGGHHATGEAVDFQLPGVDYRKLAAYLRTYPRVGVGVYTNPRTHFVHLDVRDRSFHWLDASPPGVTWREAMLRDPGQAARDASYTPESDLPTDGPSGVAPFVSSSREDSSPHR
jgi:uncharacterized protein YcbK (DUF882 family)